MVADMARTPHRMSNIVEACRTKEHMLIFLLIASYTTQTDMTKQCTCLSTFYLLKPSTLY